MERVSTAGLGQVTLQAALKVQARYAERIEQQSSGLVAEHYTELGAQGRTLVSLESTLTRVQTWSETAQTALDRVEAMHGAVGEMADLMTSLRSTLSGAMSDTDDSDGLDINAYGETMLDDLASLMTLRQDGRYLFAGGNTGVAPVDLTALTTPTIPSSADTGYYQGDSAIATVRVSEQQVVSYGVTADDSAFEQAVRAANIAATLTTSPLDETALAEAYDLATLALDALLAVQGGLSINAGRLEAARQRNLDDATVITERAADLKSVDVAVVAAQVAQYETQLQASYSAVASLAQFSLTDYL